MPKTVKPGIPAKFRLQSVRYTHIEANPDFSLVLVADPWSYLRAWLSRNAEKSRSDNKKCFTASLYYAELAMGFYDAASQSQLPTKATLLYYGMLNLAKCYISTTGKTLGKRIETHGLTSGKTYGQITVASSSSLHSVKIFHEFTRCLKTPVTKQENVALEYICSQIPEIHEMAFALNLLPSKKRHFLPIKIRFLVNDLNNRLFTEVLYEKKSEARIRGLRFLKGYRAKYFRDLGERDGAVVFRSNLRKPVNSRNWIRVYKNILQDYQKLDVWSILTPRGYRYYSNLSSPPYHQLAYVFMLMFYLGTIARYKPEETKKILSSDLAPLLTESVRLCPMQFLYQLTSLITRSICVKPHALLE